MEKRISNKVDNHLLKFKNDFKNIIIKNNIKITDNSNNDVSHMILKYIYDYDRLELTNEDFKKRKRIKNIVPVFDRCNAKRCNGEQCTRKRKLEEIYCGTHIKGTPHGSIQLDEEAVNPIRKVEVYIQEIKGINYYIDIDNNVYRPEDIISNKKNPKIITKWYLNDKCEYTIPEYNI